MTLSPVVLGAVIGLGLAMSTRMRDALVEGLGRRSLALGIAAALGIAVVHAAWLGLATSVAAGSADALGDLVDPLAVVGAGVLMAVAADVVVRAVTLGPTTGSPDALPAQPARTFLQTLVIAAIDPRALLVLVGWLAVAPATPAATDPGSTVGAVMVAVGAWWLGLAWAGATRPPMGRFRRLANVWGAALLAALAAVTLLG